MENLNTNTSLKSLIDVKKHIEQKENKISQLENKMKELTITIFDYDWIDDSDSEKQYMLNCLRYDSDLNVNLIKTKKELSELKVSLDTLIYEIPHIIGRTVEESLESLKEKSMYKKFRKICARSGFNTLVFGTWIWRKDDLKKNLEQTNSLPVINISMWTDPDHQFWAAHIIPLHQINLPLFMKWEKIDNCFSVSLDKIFFRAISKLAAYELEKWRNIEGTIIEHFS